MIKHHLNHFASLLLCTCILHSTAFATIPSIPSIPSTPAPVSLPLAPSIPTPTDAATASTATATVAVTTTPAVPAIPAVPATPVIPDYKPDIDKINEQIQLISTTKDTLKQMLTEIDGDISKAKSLLSAARTNSLKVLNQADEKQAKAVQAEIQQQLTDVTNLQKKLSDVTKKSFKDATNKIEESMKLINSIIDQLKAKGVKFEAAQHALAANAATPAVNTQTTSKNWAIPTDGKKNATRADHSPTVVHYVFHKVADMISSVLRVAYGAYTGAKDAVFGKAPAPVATPATTSAPSAPQSGAAQTASDAKPMTLAVHEAAFATIEDERDTMSTTVRTLEARLHALGETLASNKDIASSLHGGLPFIAKIQKESVWRTKAHAYFDQSLDTLSFVVARTKSSLEYAYGNYIAPLFTKIETDVTSKMDDKPKQPTSNEIPAIPITKA